MEQQICYKTFNGLSHIIYLLRRLTKVLAANAVRMSNASHISNPSTQKCQTSCYCAPYTFKQSVSLAQNTTLCRQELQYLVHSYLHMKFWASDRPVHASETFHSVISIEHSIQHSLNHKPFFT